MEDVLRVYERPYDPNLPVVCMDESCKQLVGEVRNPIPMSPGQSERVDDECVRHGVAEIFMAVEPLAGWRDVRTCEHRGREDWAHFIRDLMDGRYASAKKVLLVLDNLNTPGLASLYQTFPPAEAERLARRLDLHYTPKHGSWLNIAEIELSVYKRQCIAGRIPTLERLGEMTRQWNENRNSRQRRVDWQFRAEDARVKLKRLYPKL